MALFEQLRKSWVLGRYARVGGKLLVKRYGFAEHYSPGRVKVTLERAHMSLRYLTHACAMFCSRDEFLTWMESMEQRTQASSQLRFGDPYRVPAVAKLVDKRPTTAHRRYQNLYDELRREAARANNGSQRFLPPPPPTPIAWTPLSNELATGMKVPF